MRKKTRWACLLLAACLCLSLAGCNRPGAGQDDQPPVDESGQPSPSPSAAAEVDSLIVSLGGEPVTTDPTTMTTADEMVILSHLFEGLMKWSPSGRKLSAGVEWAQVEPGMAERYEKTVSEDGTVTYTFYLRQAQWSDGKAVTAHDFVYAWQRLMAPASRANYADQLRCVANASAVLSGQAQLTDLGVQAIDDTTFAVALTQDVPWFLELCAMPFTAPLRQDVIEESEGQWTYSAETYITNGAYQLAVWQDGYLGMEKNSNYYDKTAGPDTILFVTRSDDATDLAAFDAGSLDFLLGATPTEGKANSAPYPASYYLMFQTAQAPFDDPLVRQAFSLAVDRAALVEETATGQTPAGGLVPDGLYGADGAAGASYRTRAGDSLDPSKKAYAGNLEKAKALLSQAGYPEGAGFPAVTYLCPENAAHQAVGEALCAMWQEALGVEVTVEAVDWGTFLSRCHQGEFFMARGRWVADYDDPIAFLELWRSDAQANDARYHEEQFDTLLDRADQADSPSARMDLLAQAEDLLVGRDHALAPLYYEAQPYLKKDRLKGVCYTPLGSFLFTSAKK